MFKISVESVRRILRSKFDPTKEALKKQKTKSKKQKQNKKQTEKQKK